MTKRGAGWRVEVMVEVWVKLMGGRGGGGARRPDLLVIPFPGEERDGDSEYSESSRVHLAMGPQLASPGQRLPQWVRVQVEL